jgi:gliding motility-associated-like protein
VLSAQITPCFDAESTRGCAPFTVKLKDCSGGTSKLYTVTSSNGFTYSGFDSTITLAQAGKYTVKQYAGTGNLNGTVPLEKVDYIEVLDAVNPTFNLQVCEGRSINLTTNSGPYEQYKINWGDGSTIETVNAGATTNHIYSSETSKNIIVTGNFMPGDCGSSSSKTIIPFQALSKPEIKSVLTDNQKISINFDAKPQYQYRILEDQGSGFQQIKTILYQSGLQTLDLNRNTQTNSFTYQIEAFDDCGNTLLSEPINTFLSTFTNGDKQIVLGIPISQTNNFDKLEIYRNNQLIKTLNPGSNTFTDLDIECGNNYCYTIKAIKDNAISESIEYCMTGQSTTIPGKILHLNSTFSGEKIILNWEQANFPVKGYTIYSANISSQKTEVIGSSENNHYEDSKPRSSNERCYAVDVTDLCNNISIISSISCPIYLKIVKDPYTNLLEWNNYSGYGTISEYRVLKYDSDMNLIDEFSTNDRTNYSDPVPQKGGSYFYQIVAKNTNGFVTYSNIAEAKNDMLVIIPSAFTPNGDMINDFFIVKGKFIQHFQMSIFNNWGELIFRSESIDQGWDGKDFSTEQPSGTYAYIIEATDFDGKTLVKTGTVSLIR